MWTKDPNSEQLLAIAAELYENARLAWGCSPYHKTWEQQSQLMKTRYVRFAEKLIDNGIIGNA